MKAVIILVLVVFVGLFSQPALAGGQLWDFEKADQIDDWESINGTWEINDGVLQEVSGAESGMHAYVGDAGWKDYTFEGDMRVDVGKYAGMVFRGQDDYEYYTFYIELTPDPGNMCFFKHIAGGPGARERPSPNKTAVGAIGGIVHGEWFHFKLIVEGNEFQLFVNDEELVPEATDNLGNEYDAGKIGVFAWQTTASFDNIMVYGPEIKGAAVDNEGNIAVDSQGKLATAWGELKLN